MFEHFTKRFFALSLFYYYFHFPPVPPTFFSFGILIPCYLLYGYNNLQYTKLYNKHFSEGFRVQKNKKEMRNFEAIHQLGFLFLGSFLFLVFPTTVFFLFVLFFCVFSFYYPFFCIFAAAQKMFLI